MQLVRADLETNKIDFRLVDGGVAGRPMMTESKVFGKPNVGKPDPKTKQHKSKGGRR